MVLRIPKLGVQCNSKELGRTRVRMALSWKTVNPEFPRMGRNSGTVVGTNWWINNRGKTLEYSQQREPGGQKKVDSNFWDNKFNWTAKTGAQCWAF